MTALLSSTGARHARLLSVASYRGSRTVTNDELCAHIDSSDEWIKQRSGIAARRWATADETPLFMAVQAGRNAIERAGLHPSDVDAVMVSTISHFQQTPSLACRIAAELECDRPAAFDISAACAGFCYLLELAASLVQAGSARHVLVIGTETLSQLTNLDDRSTAFLFADGAGAAVVGPSDTAGFGPVVWGSDGSRADIACTEFWDSAIAARRSAPVLQMDGPGVFRWATTEVVQKAAEALDLAGVAPADLDVFIPHQANNRITDVMIRRLHLPASVVVSRDIAQMGNTSAASIPIAMDSLLRSGAAKSGQLALIIGFGAGLVFAGQVVELP